MYIYGLKKPLGSIQNEFKARGLAVVWLEAKPVWHSVVFSFSGHNLPVHGDQLLKVWVLLVPGPRHVHSMLLKEKHQEVKRNT